MFRRVIASALALALCASASVPAFADSEAADDSTLGTQATADDSATGDGSSAATTGTDSIRQTSYTTLQDLIRQSRSWERITILLQ